jgi:hypothetical protein
MNPGVPPSRLVNVQCTCPCDASAFEVGGKALARLYCHCAICQQLYKADYADVTAFLASAVAVPATEKITYRRYRRRRPCGAARARNVARR